MNSKIQYKRAVELHIAGECEEALGELNQISRAGQLWAKPLILSRLKAQEKRIQSSKEWLESINLLEITDIDLKNYVTAEVCNQKAQIERHSSLNSASKQFAEAALKYRMAGEPQSALIAEFNALACQDNYLVGAKRSRLWKKLNQQSKAYPLIKSNITIYLGLFARERGQAKAYPILEDAFMAATNHKQLQNRIVSQLIAAELAFYRGDLPLLSKLVERLAELFESYPIGWLKNRVTLVNLRWLILCGQLAKAQMELEYFFRQKPHRPLDLWNGNTLGLLLRQLRGHANSGNFLYDEELLLKLTAFELCHREVLLAQIQGSKRQILKVADKCIESQFEALLPDRELLECEKHDVQIFPIERRIKYLNSTKSFRSNSRSFDLLLTLAQESHHIFTKSELIEKVWQRSHYESLTDDNVLHVNINSLRKQLGKDCIVTSGGGFKWNEKRPFAIINIPA